MSRGSGSNAILWVQLQCTGNLSAPLDNQGFEMAIYEITKDQIRRVSETSFGKAGVRERADLQRLLRDRIEIVSPDTLIISEEFGSGRTCASC
jgi:hypothetical protein